MISRALVLIFFFLASSLLNAQTYNFNRYIYNDEKMINRCVDNGRFEKGSIFLEKDTLDRELLIFNRRNKNKAYLFLVSIIEDSVECFYPSDIQGYTLRGVSYFSFHDNENEYFIKQSKEGKVDLYERGSIPRDTRFLYFLQFPGVSQIYSICPEQNNIGSNPRLSNSASAYNEEYGGGIKYVARKDEKFERFIELFMSDCSEVINLVKTGYLSIHDLPDIVDIYNKCN